MNKKNNKSARMLTIIVWVGVIGMLAFFFKTWEQHSYNPNQKINTTITQSGSKQVTLKRNRFNHYVVTGKINGRQVEFILDTGASNVVIPSVLASKLKLTAGMASKAHTAAGAVDVYNAKIKNLQIGEIHLHNIAAIINPMMQSKQVLLGMSALKELDFIQSGDQLTLIQTKKLE